MPKEPNAPQEGGRVQDRPAERAGEKRGNGVDDAPREARVRPGEGTVPEPRESSRAVDREAAREARERRAAEREEREERDERSERGDREERGEARERAELREKSDREKPDSREKPEVREKDRSEARERPRGERADREARDTRDRPERERNERAEVADDDDDEADTLTSREELTPSVPPLPAAGPWRSYKEIVAKLADRIVEGQRPIRVLQSIRWDNSVEEQFFKSRFREIPKVTPESYRSIELGFDPRSKAEEFEAIARDIDAELGESDPIGEIMARSAIEYRDVVRMLEARGTPQFYGYSRKLYGSPKDKFPDGRSTLRDLGHAMYAILTKVDVSHLSNVEDRTLDAETCARTLNERLGAYFADATVRVEVDDGIIADAAAGGDYVKIRTGARFSPRDIDILEVHEGWLHVATSLNGQLQSVAKWLGKGPPRTTAVQEGLAALLEIFTFRTYPRRARKLNDRVLAVDKAEDGATFLDVFEWFRTEGYEEQECFHNTRRIFRGGVLEGGAPFTKDACYCKGIVLNYAFIRSAIQHNHVDLVPFLFVGKVAHEDVPILARRVADGVVRPPRYLPPMFRDLNGLSIWMAYSNFFSQLGGEAISDYYAKLFARAG